MSQPAGHCPNCGAPIAFQWKNAVQTVCAHCRSVVVRHDVDLKTIGEISDIPEDASPIQLGTEGRFDNHSFRVVGRIAYEYDSGGWNEWHIVFGDGTSGWLSDAQAEYAVTRQIAPKAPLPDAQTVRVGAQYQFGDACATVTTLTRARYKGVEGELPFEYWGKEDVLFADLRDSTASFLTIDYSESPALLFAGRFVEYDELNLQNVRAFEGW